MNGVDKVLVTIDREIEPPVTKSEALDFLCELLEEIHNRLEAIREDVIAGQQSGGDETIRAPVGARYAQFNDERLGSRTSAGTALPFPLWRLRSGLCCRPSIQYSGVASRIVTQQ